MAVKYKPSWMDFLTKEEHVMLDEYQEFRRRAKEMSPFIIRLRDRARNRIMNGQGIKLGVITRKEHGEKQ